jgi:hypothetical protein
MGQDRSEIPEQVVKFAPKSGNPSDETGQAVIAQIRKAAELTNENCDRAMALAHKLAMQLRETEDRSIRGGGRALSRPGDPSRRVASNDPQRN